MIKNELMPYQLLGKKMEPLLSRRIACKLEIHFTSKHGSWLDIAEIEINVMIWQCLSRKPELIAIFSQ